MKLFKKTFLLGAFLAAGGNLGAESYYFNSVTNTVQSNTSGTNIAGNTVEGVAGTFVNAADADEFRFEGDLIFESDDRVYFGGDKPIRIFVNGDVVIPNGMIVDGSGSIVGNFGAYRGAGGGTPGAVGTAGAAGGGGTTGGGAGSGGGGGAGGAWDFWSIVSGSGGGTGTAGGTGNAGASGGYGGFGAAGGNGFGNTGTGGTGGNRGIIGSASGISTGIAGLAGGAANGGGATSYVSTTNSTGSGSSGGNGGNAGGGGAGLHSQTSATVLAGGGAGGSGGGGAGGAGGSKGGGGGAGGGGGGGRSGTFNSGGKGGNGGNGGAGGNGGSGGTGKAGLPGGHGGGGFEIRATGRIIVGGALRSVGANASTSTGINAGSGGSVGANGGGGAGGSSNGDGQTGGPGGNGCRGRDGGTGGSGGAGGGGGGGAGGTIKLTANVITGSYDFDLRGGGGASTGSRGRFITEKLAGDVPGATSFATVVNVNSGVSLTNQYYWDVSRSLPVISDLKGGPDFSGLSRVDSAVFEALPFVNAPQDSAAMIVKMDVGPPPYNYAVPGHSWFFFVNLSGANLPAPALSFGSNPESGLNTYGSEKLLRSSGTAYRPLGGPETPFANRPIIPSLGANEVFVVLMESWLTWTSASYQPSDVRVGVSSRTVAVDSPIYIPGQYAIVGTEIKPPSGSIIYRDLNGSPRQPDIALPAGVSGSAYIDFFYWNARTAKLYSINPVTAARVKWKKLQTDPNPIPADNSHLEERIVSSGWPSVQEGLQVHVTRVSGSSTEPRAPMDLTASQTHTFQRSLYSQPSVGLQVTTDFITTGEGYTTLLYTQGQGTTENSADPVIRVVRTHNRNNPAVSSDAAMSVGQIITDPIHNHPTRNGYIVTPDSTVFDAAGSTPSYNRAQQNGSIIPVNVTIGADRDTVVWYQTDALGIAWPVKAVNYAVTWPAAPNEIVLTSFKGSEGNKSDGSPQYFYTTAAASDVSVYVQDNPALAGYNLNEEHALIALGQQGPAAFAVRNDLNTLPGASSEPYVLVKYKDLNNAAAWTMNVYKVLLTSPQYGFSQFTGVAGNPVQPPNPISLLNPVSPKNSASGPAAWVDRTGQVWGKRNGELIAKYYYPLKTGFWWTRDLDGVPGVDGVGASVPWMDRYTSGPYSSPEGQPLLTTFNITWPTGIPKLLLGDTLSAAKGGLPAIEDMASASIIFDEANPTLANPLAAMGVIYDSQSPYFATVTGAILNGPVLQIGARQLGLAGIGNNEYEFTDLPFSLKKRLYWDDTRQKLGFRGFDGTTPSNSAIFLPNIMTNRDRQRIFELDDEVAGNSGTPWDIAVTALYQISRNPAALDLDSNGSPDDKVLVGYAKDGANVVYADALDGKVLVASPGPQAAIPARGGAYITIAENNDSSLLDPINLHIVEITTPPVTGHVVVIPEENPLVERISLRLNLDLAGLTDDMDFEWYIQADGGGPPPPPSAANPNGSNGWLEFQKGKGLNEIVIEGAGIQTLQDNWIFARWKGFGTVGNYTAQLSAFAGDPAATGTPLPVFVKGWIKRVTEGINLFDQRIADFRENEAQTYVSVVTQAGQRYEGDAALNLDAVQTVGLIELYETILRRGVGLSIEGTPSQSNSATDNALLLVASRIADLYMLVGNEAYSDAMDPTIGIGGSGELLSIASRLFSFANQLPNLLEEELALLRGRDDSGGGVGAAPVYNRLFWNFTSGLEGEPVYVSNYGIGDYDLSGNINELDAKALYPQGHGDAWGHYLTAQKAYYRLMRHPLYVWQRRAETTTVSGVAIQVDYLDERKFAAAAAAKAKAGVDIVDLNYRKLFTANAAGQWQGYKDSNKTRAWGVDEWGRRATQGAYLDWLTGNAVLPAIDANPNATPLEKVDRTTVLELSEVVETAREVQKKIDSADRGLNPLGMASNAIPFDIDPTQAVNPTPSQRKSHFEQVYQRAIDASQNALQVFSNANTLTNRIRDGILSEQDFATEVVETELDYKAQMIEIYGYPHTGNIGSGKLYPTGYDGPDIYYWRYIDTAAVTGETVPGPEIVVSGLFKAFAQDITLPQGGTQPTDFSSLVGHFFASDVQNLADLNNSVLAANFPLRPEARYPFVKPASWGTRRAPGELQIALIETVKLDAALRGALSDQKNLVAQIKDELDLLKANFDLSASDIAYQTGNAAAQGILNELVAAGEIAHFLGEAVSKRADLIAAAAKDGLPKVTGISSDFSFVGRAIIDGIAVPTSIAASVTAITGKVGAITLAAQKEAIALDSNIQITKAQYSFDIQQRLKLIEQLIRQEVGARLAIFEAVQEITVAQGRVDQLVAEAQRIADRRTLFRIEVAGDVQNARYKDITYRNFRNDALRKYRSYFDLAGLYTYLAAKVYDYETSLPKGSAGSGDIFLSSIVRERGLGEFLSGVPQATTTGLSQPLAAMNQSYGVLKTQLGLNNPQNESNRFSLRDELFRLRGSDDEIWEKTLSRYLVTDLNSLPAFKQYCRPFASGVEPGLVIPFSTKVMSGQNYFGMELGGGDSFYDSSRFATRIHSVGVWFKNYEKTGTTTQPLANTPRVYLVPVGTDIFRVSSNSPGGVGDTREFTVLDQVMPQMNSITSTKLGDTNWIPFNDIVGGNWTDTRRFSRFLAYDDDGLQTSQVNADTRLIGRSVWNTEWLLIIPGASLLGDQNEGLKRFIYGQPVPGNPTQRDGNGIKDIKLFFQTYSHGGI